MGRIQGGEEMNVREYWKGNQKWTIQRNWQHRVHKTEKNKTKTSYNICWIPLHANKHKQRKQESSYRQLEAKTNRWGDRWLYILLRLPQFHNTCIQHTNSSFMSPKHGWYEKLQCLHGMICYGWSGKSCCVNSVKVFTRHDLLWMIW